MFFTYAEEEEEEKEGALFVVKLGIPDFLLGCFTNDFTDE